MAGPGNILIKIGADTADAVRGISSVDDAMQKTAASHNSAASMIKKAAVPAAIAFTAIAAGAVKATKAAAEDEAAQSKLAGQLKRVTGATDKQIAASEDYISKLSLQTGVADDELRPALGKLASASHSTTQAQEDLQLALDISAQSGKSLDTVSSALAKGYAGNTAALGKLVPGMDKATLASKDMSKITDELADKVGGAASEAAQTATGRYKVMSNQLNETEEAIGGALIPVLNKFMPIIQRATTFVSEHTDALTIIIGVVAGVSGAILVANAALKAYEAIQIAVKIATAAWTAAQWLLNAALDANPIGVVVIALGALAVAIKVAWDHSETFRNIVRGAMGAVETAIDAVKQAFNELRNAAFLAWDWIVDHWKLALFAFGPIGAAVYAVLTNFQDLKRGADAAFDVIKGGIMAVKNAIVAAAIAGVLDPVRAAVNALADAFSAVSGAASSAWNWIASHWNVASFAFGPITAAIDAIRAAFGAMAGAASSAWSAVSRAVSAIHSMLDGVLSRIQSALDKLKSVPGKILGAINPFAVPAPPSTAPAPSTRGSARSPAAPGGLTVNVYGAVDPEGTARAINRIMQAHTRRVGSTAWRVGTAT